ncbi:hypothetical protein DSL72_007614 [Monilinia vaccinii-corymbosi]|uniref:Uncharacterized protein n=1 Tax=Monilinia vaccinii-corymbosi TaxID=61207 RepID=A0A8A3PIH9_9HELO|nr:hypothetical protein DSL72_007614 [Monilinia vaccinii-corymbosi]
MPATLGKRKRISATIPSSSKLFKVSKTAPIIPEPVSEPQSSDSSPDDDEDEDEEEEEEEEDDTEPLDPQEVFRRHFEAQFKPLPPPTKKSKASQTVEDPENEEDDNWDGLSDNSAEEDEDDEPNGIEVVEHVKKVDSRIAGMTKAELRAFMSSKIPKSLPATPISQLGDPTVGSADEAGASETLNLKNDLALQRLLDESHLLTSSSSSSLNNAHATHSLQGRNRLKALDLRVQALGAKTSIYKQEKMPMKMRKGMVRKAEEKEEARRREARENGIVLETKRAAKGGRERRRERSGVGGTFDGGPGVGRMRGATLRLSERDVHGIEGSRRGCGRMGRNGKRGGRGRGRGNRS